MATTNYWLNRYKRESEKQLKDRIDKATTELQDIWLAIADDLADKIVAKYAKLDNLATHSYDMKRDQRFYKQVLEKLKELGVKTEDVSKTNFEAIYKMSCKYVDKKMQQAGLTPADDDIDMRATAALRAPWADDGTNWSTRIWKNTAKLGDALEKSLVRAVALGEGPMRLTAELMRDFSVSFSAAKRLVVTELAHFYNTAAAERMEAAGVEQWIWLTAKDEKVCEICGKLDGKKFPVSAKDKLPPAGSHCQCRCTILADITLEVK